MEEVIADSTLNGLYDGNVAFRLYADYANGMTVRELALISSRSEEWVRERIEAMRLCLEKQVALDFQPGVELDRVWAAQVWD